MWNVQKKNHRNSSIFITFILNFQNSFDNCITLTGKTKWVHTRYRKKKHFIFAYHWNTLLFTHLFNYSAAVHLWNFWISWSRKYNLQHLNFLLENYMYKNSRSLFSYIIFLSSRNTIKCSSNTRMHKSDDKAKIYSCNYSISLDCLWHLEKILTFCIEYKFLQTKYCYFQIHSSEC